MQKSRLAFTGVVPTTRVAFSFEGRANQSEQWPVMDDGHTLETGRWPRLCHLWDAVTDTYWAGTFPIKTQEAGRPFA
jgi:hypothetical protein